ncbi:MAG: Malonyl CoA-acyl carrier protein transacylase, partial [Planctomycetota bacterium]
YDLAKICFEGPAESLDSTVHSQPALYVSSMAALASLQQERPDRIAQCDITAGLSLGEYTALAFAGVFRFEDGLRLVQIRGEAMQAASDAAPSGMVSILGLERPQIESLCDQHRLPGEVLQVANMLCPGNIVVSGSRAACDRIYEAAPAAGAMKAIRLAVAGAFHTPLMQSAVDKLRAALEQIPMQAARIPVVSNVDAKPHTDPNEIRELLVKQVVSPVLWEDSLRWMIADGCGEFCEIGAGRVLAGLLKRVDRKLKIENVSA